MIQTRRKGVLALAACVTCGLMAPPAQASFHLMKIQEVGQGGGGQVDHVVLQMYAAGQNLVAGKQIRTYDSTGTPNTTFTFPGNVAFGDNQRTIYIARLDGTPPGTPDFTAASGDLFFGDSGAVCFGEAFGPNQAIDCVSFGAFPGVTGGDPSPMGTPAPALGTGQAIQRSIAPGCPTLLEGGDDTNNSAVDFALAPPALRNNAVTPTEKECDTDPPQTKIRKRPKNRSDDTSPTFRFRSDEPGSTFKCKLDKKKFRGCKSPKTYRGLEPGKHVFKVKATDAEGNVDKTAAKDRFKVLED